MNIAETTGLLPWHILALVTLFCSVVFITYGLLEFLSKGIQSYEEKYVAGAVRTLDAMYLTMTAQQILYVSLLSSLATFILMAVTLASVPLGVILGLTALVAPYTVIRILKWRRDRQFATQLVDALLALGNALRAGHSLPMALELVAREADNPMGQEMRLVTQEMRLGVSMEDALLHLQERMPGEGLDILITSISISREVGGNLAEIFDTIADTIRDRHRIEGRIAAMTAQGKLQGIIICMIPVMIGVFLNAWSPQLMRPMFTDWLGIVMLCVIIGMEGIGGFMIYRIVSIKV